LEKRRHSDGHDNCPQTSERLSYRSKKQIPFFVRYHEAEAGPIGRRNQERDFGHNIRKKYTEVGTLLIGKGTVKDVGGMNALGKVVSLALALEWSKNHLMTAC